MSKKAVRKKATRKQAARKTKSVSKKAASKKTTRKKTAGKKAASRKTAGKKTARKTAPAKKAARKKAARSKKVSYMPAPFRSVTPYLIVDGGAAAIDFYKKAFGAIERFRIPAADGKTLGHAEIMVGDSVVMLCDESVAMNCKSPRSLGGTSTFIHLYVPNVDAAYSRAVAAGAEGSMPPADMFWGDRFSQVTDPFGHRWSLATHLHDPSPAEIAAGMAAMGKSS